VSSIDMGSEAGNGGQYMRIAGGRQWRAMFGICVYSEHNMNPYPELTSFVYSERLRREELHGAVAVAVCCIIRYMILRYFCRLMRAA
jgi:hypothetical protein